MTDRAGLRRGSQTGRFLSALALLVPLLVVLVASTSSAALSADLAESASPERVVDPCSYLATTPETNGSARAPDGFARLNSAAATCNASYGFQKSPDGQMQGPIMAAQVNVHSSTADTELFWQGAKTGDLSRELLGGTKGKCQPLSGYGERGLDCVTSPEETYSTDHTILFTRGCLSFVGGVARYAKTDATWEGRLKEYARSVDESFKKSPACPAASAPVKIEVAIDLPEILMLDSVDGKEGEAWDYGQLYEIDVRVSKGDWRNGQVLSDASVKVYFDDALIKDGYTSSQGYLKFFWSVPETMPVGRSLHKLRATVSKTGLPSGEGTNAVVVRRDMLATTLSVQASPSPVGVGAVLRVSGVVSARVGLVTWLPVRSRVVITGKFDVKLADVTTDREGYFAAVVDVTAGLLTGAGSSAALPLSVTAYPVDTTRYLEVNQSLIVPAEVKGKLVTSVQTDKAAYRVDEPIVVSGKVALDGKPFAGPVLIGMNGTAVTTVTAGADGAFSHTLAGLPSGVFPVPNVPFSVEAQARTTGYDSSPAAAYFVFVEDAAPCTLGELTVAQVKGSASAESVYADPSSPTAPGSVQPGAKLPPGVLVKTPSKGDGLALSLRIGDSLRGMVVLRDETAVRLGRFCRQTSGRYLLRLYTSNPASLLVSIDSQATGDPIDVEIVTPAGKVANVKTRYQVQVDAQGETTVAVDEGTVRLSDLSGSNSVSVEAGQQLRLAPGKAPARADVGQRTLARDAEAEKLMGQPGPTTIGPSTTATPAAERPAAPQGDGDANDVLTFVGVIVAGAVVGQVAARIRRPRKVAPAGSQAPPPARPASAGRGADPERRPTDGARPPRPAGSAGPKPDYLPESASRPSGGFGWPAPPGGPSTAAGSFGPPAGLAGEYGGRSSAILNAAVVCPKCGMPEKPTDRFCRRCGAPAG